MPSKLPHLISLRGDEAYARYLDRVIRALKAQRGTTIGNHHQLAEHALAVLGAGLGLKAPRRMPPLGTNRFTSGQKRE